MWRLSLSIEMGVMGWHLLNQSQPLFPVAVVGPVD